MNEQPPRFFRPIQLTIPWGAGIALIAATVLIIGWFIFVPSHRLIVIFVTSVAAAFGLIGTNMSRNRNNGNGDGGEGRRVILLSCVLMLAALVIYGFNLHFFTKIPSVFEPLIHIAIAIFVIGAVSLMIEFRDFTDYATRQLSRIVIKEEYLKKMGVVELKKLRDRIVEVSFGSSAITTKGGFYQFVDEEFTEGLRSPYREEYREYATIQIHPSCAGIWRKTVTSHYKFIKGFSGPQRMKVTWGAFIECIPDLANEPWKHFELVRLSVVTSEGTDTFKFDLTQQASPPAEREMGSGVFEVRLTPKIENRDKSEVNMPVKFSDKGKIRMVHAEFEYPIPGSEIPGHDFEVEVEIEETHCLSPNEYFSFIGMALPTRNLIATYIFPPGVTTDVAPFALTEDASRILDQGSNIADVKISGWMLPGHGILIAWRSVSGSAAQTDQAGDAR